MRNRLMESESHEAVQALSGASASKVNDSSDYLERRRLQPQSGTVYIVRYIRQGNRPDVCQRFYSRKADAEKYVAKLRSYGRKPIVFVAYIDQWAGWTM